ncbi:exosortase A [Pelomonas sp. SE-A7]|uniref:exosortase A n=1 Tax=Pelomonas sp. SE-A7 TaxID=3054953 RepID=UPI00259CE1A2|nr:exosortase A [Pelomonas sp. SE-A7]MDM4764876.1 exosortase A [Pelomonas sp. SE-A7]
MSRVMPKPAIAGIPPHWRQPLAALLVLLLGLGWLFRDTLMAMVVIWERSETFAHAFVVPPISLWLIWRRRQSLAALVPKAWPLMVLPLALLAVGWLLGELVSTNSVTQLAVVAMIVMAVPLVLGREVAWHIAFPLGFLFFCVPIGEFMMPMLMESTADFTVAALRFTGIPVYREGLQFVIPSGNWSVVEACSGVRYLIASLMVGTLFAYLNYRSMRKRLIFIGVAILLPIVANWMRAYGIVMLGHVSGNKLAVGVDHLIYGWVFFGIVMLAMFSIGARFSDPDEQLVTASDLPVVPAGAAASIWPWMLAALLGLLGTRLALDWLNRQTGPRDILLSAPALAGWRSGAAALGDWSPVFQKPAGTLQTVYGRGSERVGLHLAYYRQQGYDSKLANSQNMLVLSYDKQWARVSESATRLELPLSGSTAVRTGELRPLAQLGDSRLVVWQFFWVDGHVTSSDIRVKLYTAASRLLGRGDDSAAVTVYTDKDEENSGRSEQRLRQFLSENWPAIERQLQASRGSRP